MTGQNGAVTDDMPELKRLGELRELVEDHPGAFVRYSHGPEADAGRPSTDYESGLELPGLAVNPLTPEPWWTRPLEDWLAREVCAYVHLGEQPDGRFGWVLEGDVVGRGPDNEPLVRMTRPLARLSAELVEEAKRRYDDRFEIGRDSRG